MPHPKTKPVQPIKTDRKTKTDPAAHPDDDVFKRLGAVIGQNVDRLLQEFSLEEEGKRGRLARAVLRAKREGQMERAESLVKPLFMAVGESLTGPDQGKRDESTGEIEKQLSLPPEWQEPWICPVEERRKRFDAYRARVKNLGQYPEFAALDPDLDQVCVLALVDLLSYGEHDIETMDDAFNWVGALVSDVLLEVARSGPESLNARPEKVREIFDMAIDNLRDTMALCLQLRSVIPSSVVDEIEKWNEPAKSSAAGAP